MIPDDAIPGASLFKLLLSWLRSFSESRRKELTSIGADANAMFEELQRDHELFLTHIVKIRVFAENARTSIPRVNDFDAVFEEFRALGRQVEDTRLKGQGPRRSRYEMARIYVENELETMSIWKTIPDDVSEAFRAYMVRYTGYFQKGRRYEHGLSSVLHMAREIYWLRDKPEGSVTSAIVERFKDLEEYARKCEQDLSSRWAAVARGYHELVRVSRKYGGQPPPKRREKPAVKAKN